jgi:anti-sigma regulatory factor (Ser/Thr protein kinase)
MKKHFSERYPAEADKTTVVYNGVSLDKFKPALRTGELSIGMLGSIIPRKRVYEAILTFSRLRRQGLRATFHLGGGGIHGPGYDEYYVACRRLVQKLELCDCVHFHEHVSDTADWLRSIDVFISNSYWEGQQVALLEALASGLLEAARKHAGGALKDDAAVIVFGTRPGFGHDDVYHFKLRDDAKCLASIRRELETKARLAGFEGRELWDIVSAVFEAVVNAVTHGSTEASLELRLFDDRLEAEIKDGGNGFVYPAVSAVPPPTATRGRGIPLMKSFMDEVNFNNNGGCAVTLTKYRRMNI